MISEPISCSQNLPFRLITMSTTVITPQLMTILQDVIDATSWDSDLHRCASQTLQHCQNCSRHYLSTPQGNWESILKPCFSLKIYMGFWIHRYSQLPSKTKYHCIRPYISLPLSRRKTIYLITLACKPAPSTSQV